MKKITVFTPAYNRVGLLPRLYESLCRQTSDDFLWLIIDDGSTDGTKELAKKWQNENRIEIRYVYKANGGMHSAHNTAYSMIETELNVCIDSDDWMPDDAVELILKTWNSIENKNDYSGIIGLDADNKGRVIGTEMPENVKKGSYYDLYSKNKAKGDKKFVLRTLEVKKHPNYPEYPNEKLVPLGILYIMMGEKKPFIFSNKIFCIVEYQAEGSSNTILKQYRQSPKGFAYARKIGKTYSKSFINKFKNSVHLVSSAVFANQPKLIFEKPLVLLNILALPFGILLNIYIRIKTKD